MARGSAAERVSFISYAERKGKLMKTIVGALCAAAAVVALTACGGGNALGERAAVQGEVGSDGVEIKQSPDKYTWYMKSYVGMNAASVGYEALDGFRHDTYGAGNIKVIFVSENGAFVDPGNEEQLKEYVVTSQSYEPNAVIKYTFQTDSNGEEFDNLLDSQNIEEIVLAVSKVEEASQGGPDLTEVQASPDKYTHYVRDYVGRNLAECGYCSLSGNLTDAYGDGYVFFDIVADDGAFVDPEDEASLAGYLVTSQSVKPNTAIELRYATDSEGNEYSSLVSDQSLESITLNVTKAPTSGYPVGDDAAAADDAAGTQAGSSSTELSGDDFREFMDSYEAFMNEYVDFMLTFSSSTNPANMVGDYADMMARYSDMVARFDEIDEGSLSQEDAAYYVEVSARVTARLAEIGQ